jgi:Protein of unknown function (DUF4087)
VEVIVPSFRRKLALTGLIAALAPEPVSTPSRAEGLRCGWFDNPSPGNASLFDKDDEWIIAVQGGHQADGDWPPDFPPGQWIKLGAGDYGYGCACLTVDVDAQEKTVTKIMSGTARPLSVCRKDSSVARLEKKLR